MYWIIILYLSIIISFVVFLVFLYDKIQFWLKTLQTQENYTDSYNDIIFLSKNELEDILVSDKDNFYNRFYKTDFELRKINNISEYTSKIKNSVTDFTENEKKYISEIITSINLKFENIVFPWLNGKKFNKLKWKIGLVNGYEYENGLPHTRGEYIIIHRDQINHYNFSKTMIHEKVHVYQKMYPEDVEIFLKLNNFKKIRKVNEYDRIRANMDIDEWIYADHNGNEYKAVFNKNPFDIQDVTFSPCNSQLCEHPFEKMAIDISRL
jgi:hypothetical protein